MRLSPARFNGFLSGPVSQRFGWRRADACPCFNPDSGAADQACTLCRGKGWTWRAEVTADCFAGMTNQTPAKGMAAFGVWEPGDATLTIPANSALYNVGWYDRIRALDSTNPFSSKFIHDGGDALLGSISCIDRVYWLADDRVTIVEGGIPQVADNGALSWSAGEPPAGRAYAINGVKYDEFFVFKTLSSDRNSGINGLPKKLLARVFDLLGR